MISASRCASAIGRAVLIVPVLTTLLPASDAAYAGYTASSTQVERRWEEKFRELPQPANARRYMQHLTEHPHSVGSPYGKLYPEWIRDQLVSWGLNAHIETFEVLYPSPVDRLLELLGPKPFRATLAEPPVPGDPTSHQSAEQLPTYNAYGADGDVTAPLVYVNYGLPSDYDTLERMGVSVKGAIVIARYGHCWRGVKVSVAHEHGALGCILYSDPADDGYAMNSTFPNGPARSPDSVQRGGVTENRYQGDPLTPGIGSTPGAPRIKREDAAMIQKIPVLPISYADAQPLLEATGSLIAPRDWRGALPITYRLGPSRANVHLRVKCDWAQKNVYDVIASIPGSVDPDQWILRGNHHDAWTYGAFDPISGAVSLMEEARSLAALQREGWRPKRTVVLCFWDGEEPANLGSTEWVETHAKELAAHGAVYINSDASMRGVLDVEGTAVLAPFINEVASDIPDPETRVSVGRRKFLTDVVDNDSSEVRKRLRAEEQFLVSPIGDGSDYAAFIDFLGIPSLDVSFSNNISRGIYHSIYDDFTWYSKFGDPDFTYSRALAQLLGSAVMRSADADVLPFDFSALATAIKRYCSHAYEMVEVKRLAFVERQKEQTEGVFKIVQDESGQRIFARPELVEPALNLSVLDAAAASFVQTASVVTHEMTAFLTAHEPPSPEVISKLNQFLLESGAKLTDPAGLPRRFWYKNQIYAPGEYTGYAANPLPGITDAIDRSDWSEAQAQAAHVAAAIEREQALLKSIEALLPKGFN